MFKTDEYYKEKYGNNCEHCNENEFTDHVWKIQVCDECKPIVEEDLAR